jgi:chromosome segregation ATPase
MTDDTERLVAEIQKHLKRRAKADPRSIREITESALEREFSTTETAAVERRIEEVEQRIQTLQREINERERELAEHQDKKERLERQIQDHRTRREEQLAEARETLADAPADPENPAVKNWADKLGMTPEGLVREL